MYEDPTETVTSMGTLANVSSFSHFEGSNIAHSTPFATRGSGVVGVHTDPLNDTHRSAQDTTLMAHTTESLSHTQPMLSAHHDVRKHLSPIMELSHEGSSHSSTSARADITQSNDLTIAADSHPTIPRDVLLSLPGFVEVSGPCPVLRRGAMDIAGQRVEITDVSEHFLTATGTLGGELVSVGRLDLATAGVEYKNACTVYEQFQSLASGVRQCVYRPIGLQTYQVCFIILKIYNVCLLMWMLVVMRLFEEIDVRDLVWVGVVRV